MKETLELSKNIFKKYVKQKGENLLRSSHLAKLLNMNEEDNPDSYCIEQNIAFSTEEIEKPYKYIFLRIYDVKYLNPLVPANILKFGIDRTEIYNIKADHVSINFSLDDSFYGLTSGGRYQLSKESCTNTANNKFMIQCNANESNQTTYGLMVSESEYENIKNTVEKYASTTNIKFDLIQDLKMAKFATKRKFFTSEEKQLFGTVDYPDDTYRDIIKKAMGTDKKENFFICSSFIAYCLILNVPRIRKWFDDNNINFRYVNVTDTIHIPGVVKLFSSRFYDYKKAANELADKYPQFKEYI